MGAVVLFVFGVVVALTGGARTCFIPYPASPTPAPIARTIRIETTILVMALDLTAGEGGVCKRGSRYYVEIGEKISFCKIDDSRLVNGLI